MTASRRTSRGPRIIDARARYRAAARRLRNTDLNDFALTCTTVANCETWRGDVGAMVPCLEGGHFPYFLDLVSTLAGNRRFTISCTLVGNSWTTKGNQTNQTLVHMDRHSCMSRCLDRSSDMLQYQALPHQVRWGLPVPNTTATNWHTSAFGMNLATSSNFSPKLLSDTRLPVRRTDGWLTHRSNYGRKP